jgi:hypothetical protein
MIQRLTSQLLLIIFFCCGNLVILPAQDSEPTRDYDPCLRTSSEFPSACGISSSNHLCNEFESFTVSEGYNITSANQGTSGGTVSNKNIYVASSYQLTVTVEFINCNFAMGPGSVININPSASQTVIFTDCKFFASGCDEMWKRIKVDPSSQVFTFFFRGCQIEDAFSALTLREGGKHLYSIYDNIFANNYIGISNKLQNFSPLQVFINRNEFYSNANLLTSSLSDPMPFYPRSFAGCHFIKTQVVSGNANDPVYPNNAWNTFSCMLYGIYTENSILASFYNTFQNLDVAFGAGIYANGGNITAYRNLVQGYGNVGFEMREANLYATSNQFKDHWYKGIESYHNEVGEIIQIKNNTFTLTTDASSWSAGIWLTRSRVKPVGTIVAHNEISGNYFDVENSSFFSAILVFDQQIGATDQLLIHDNTIIWDNDGTGGYGIRVQCYNGNNIKVYDNDLEFTGTYSNLTGIALQYVEGGQNTGTNHEVYSNQVTGELISSAANITCAIHTNGSPEGEIRYCENIVDFSGLGMHFLDDNRYTQLRENHFNNHNKGLFIESANISKPLIGAQSGRGNTWLPDKDACIENAAEYKGITNTNGALLSIFTIKETNTSTYTYFPDAGKIKPPLSGTGSEHWFILNINADEDYCDPELVAVAQIIITVEEENFMAGDTSGMSTVQIWEKRRGLYKRILFHPDIAPTLSTAAAWFSAMTGSSPAAYAQFDYDMAEIGTTSTNHIPALDSLRQLIYSTLAHIGTLDASTDVTVPSNLTTTFLGYRENLLEDLSDLATLEQTEKSVIETQIQSDVTSALSQNNSLPSANAWEGAHKLLNQVMLYRIKGALINDTVYAQLLDLALASNSDVGSANNNAVMFLATCDQVQFLARLDRHGYEERSGFQKHGIKSENKVIVTPNPAQDNLRLSLPDNWITGHYEIYNSQGITQKTGVLTGRNSIGISLSGLINGWYSIMIVDENSIPTISSFIIQH